MIRMIRRHGCFRRTKNRQIIRSKRTVDGHDTIGNSGNAIRGYFNRSRQGADGARYGVRFEQSPQQQIPIIRLGQGAGYTGKRRRNNHLSP